MKSQREIEKEYNKLLTKVKTDKYFTEINLTNRVNCYVCQSCGHITKTKDTDAGTTPFMNNCELCNNIAYSTFYKDIIPNEKPTHEWFRPTLKETIKWRKKNPAMLEHILKGGLDYRKIK